MSWAYRWTSTCEVDGQAAEGADGQADADHDQADRDQLRDTVAAAGEHGGPARRSDPGGQAERQQVVAAGHHLPPAPGHLGRRVPRRPPPPAGPATAAAGGPPAPPARPSRSRARRRAANRRSGDTSARISSGRGDPRVGQRGQHRRVVVGLPLFGGDDQHGARPAAPGCPSPAGRRSRRPRRSPNPSASSGEFHRKWKPQATRNSSGRDRDPRAERPVPPDQKVRHTGAGERGEQGVAPQAAEEAAQQEGARPPARPGPCRSSTATALTAKTTSSTTWKPSPTRAPYTKPSTTLLTCDRASRAIIDHAQHLEDLLEGGAADRRPPVGGEPGRAELGQDVLHRRAAGDRGRGRDQPAPGDRGAPGAATVPVPGSRSPGPAARTAPRTAGRARSRRWWPSGTRRTPGARSRRSATPRGRAATSVIQNAGRR